MRLFRGLFRGLLLIVVLSGCGNDGEGNLSASPTDQEGSGISGEKQFSMQLDSVSLRRSVTGEIVQLKEDSVKSGTIKVD